MKKIILVLSLLLGMSVLIEVPTHACDDCGDHEHVVVTSLGEIATPYATVCPECGGKTTTIKDNEYELQKWTQCIHGNTTRDYIYKVYTTTSYKCNSCGKITVGTTTTSYYTSCGKEL